MDAAVILSIDESIQKLKTEIISQDWRLPQRRIEPLEAAFACLKQHFRNKKNALAILTMADNVLKYIKKHGNASEPSFIDFLKEAMAHVVTIFEDHELDPEQERQLFQRVYEQFSRLRQKIHTQKKPADTMQSPAKQPASQARKRHM